MLAFLLSCFECILPFNQFSAFLIQLLIEIFSLKITPKISEILLPSLLSPFLKYLLLSHALSPIHSHQGSPEHTRVRFISNSQHCLSFLFHISLFHFILISQNFKMFIPIFNSKKMSHFHLQSVVQEKGCQRDS